MHCAETAKTDNNKDRSCDGSTVSTAGSQGRRKQLRSGGATPALRAGKNFFGCPQFLAVSPPILRALFAFVMGTTVYGTSLSSIGEHRINRKIVNINIIQAYH
jgi:hypothetical protein